MTEMSPIDPPTKSNILAIEAPAYGAGRYKVDIRRVVVVSQNLCAGIETPPDALRVQAINFAFL